MSLPTLYLIRGLPNSGKTTLAKMMGEQLGVDHVENDMFFVDEHGNYTFEGEKFYDAVLFCKSKFLDNVKRRKSIIVSNVFPSPRMALFYIDTCKKNGYNVQIITLQSDWSYKNEHNVPDEVYKSMKNSFSSSGDWLEHNSDALDQTRP